jgi:predicted transposase YbfD/YdcC
LSATYCPPAARVEPSQIVTTVQARSAQVAQAGGVAAEGLLECLAQIPDPRDRRGVRYALASVVALCLAAVLSGEKTREDIVAWAAAAPRWLLAAVGINARGGRLRAPHADTVDRLLNRMDGQATDDAIGRWFAGRAGLGVTALPRPVAEFGIEVTPEVGVGVGVGVEPVPSVTAPDVLPVLLVNGQPAAVAVDGKAMAGAVGADGRPQFVLAAATHAATSVLAQRQIGPKSNEIPSFAPLLAGLDLAGAVVTMDSLHTQRAHARFLVTGKRAHFVMIVKENQPRLFDTLDDLPWKDVPIADRGQETGHGRNEVRTIQVMDAPDGLEALFPHVKQVFLVERYTTRTVRCRRRGSGRYYTKVVKTAVAVLGITSLTAGQATPAQLAALVRGHWSIEAMHWVRDVTFREDASTIATGTRPRLMATLRNTAIGLIRQSGTRRIAATIRKLKHDPHHLLAMMGLNPPPEWAPDLR